MNKDDEVNMVDAGMLNNRYPNHWAVQADKGYQGLLELLRTYHIIKKPLDGVLPRSDEAF